MADRDPVQRALDDLRDTIFREAERNPGPLTEVRLAQERLDAVLDPPKKARARKVSARKRG